MTKDEYLAMRGVVGEPIAHVIGDNTHYLRRCTVGEYESYIAWCNKNKDEYAGVRARLLVRCLCDTDGKRVFTDAEIGLIDALPNAMAEELFVKAKEVCGFTTAPEEREKNLEPTESANSATA